MKRSNDIDLIKKDDFFKLLDKLDNNIEFTESELKNFIFRDGIQWISVYNKYGDLFTEEHQSFIQALNHLDPVPEKIEKENVAQELKMNNDIITTKEQIENMMDWDYKSFIQALIVIENPNDFNLYNSKDMDRLNTIYEEYMDNDEAKLLDGSLQQLLEDTKLKTKEQEKPSIIAKVNQHKKELKDRDQTPKKGRDLSL